MPKKKLLFQERGYILMDLAKKYRDKHPNVQWKYCIAEASKLYKEEKNKKMKK
jgi:hypothetical protein